MKTRKVEPEITITVSYSEIKALTTATDSFMEFCKVSKIEVPVEFRVSLYGLFFRMMMKLKETHDAESN